jgi:hypothetical protein
MPTSMVQRRSEILALIAVGRSNRWIAGHYGHGRSLLRKVRETLARDPSQISVLHHAIGAPKQIVPVVTAKIDDLTAANRPMPSTVVARIITETANMPALSPLSVRHVRHVVGYEFLPPITTFPLTSDQIADRRSFACKYAPFDWTKTVSIDESSFVLGTCGWIWRRRVETGPEVRWTKHKFPPKAMVFAGISKDEKFALIAIESGTVNAESSVDDFVDQSGIIPDMNARYGAQQWTYM